jgi:hypothetical protein
MAPPPRRHSSAKTGSKAPATHAPTSTQPHHPTSSATTAAARTIDPTTAAPSPVAQSTNDSGSAAWPTIGALAVVAALGVTAWLVARRRTG